MAERVLRFTLANGLKVALLPDPSRPRAAVSLTYDVGGGDDPSGYHGMAHLLEHLMFETANAASGEGHMELASQTGGHHNGMTTPDQTTYLGVYPTHQLERALWLEANRMAYLLRDMDETKLERARAAVLNEWQEREGEGGTRSMMRHVSRSLYPQGHPYFDYGDKTDDIRAIELQHLQWFFQKHYRPSNATLAVVGAFDGARLRKSIEGMFGPIRFGGVQAGPQASPETLTEHVELVVKVPNESQSCMLTWRTEHATSKEADVMTLLAAYLDRRVSGALVKDADLARYSDVSFHSQGRGDEFYINVWFTKDQGPKPALAGIRKELEDLRKGLVDNGTLDTVRSFARQRALFSVQSPMARALRLSTTPAGDYRSTTNRAADLYSTGAQQLVQAARRVLSTGPHVRACTRYAPKASKRGRVSSRRVVKGGGAE